MAIAQALALLDRDWDSIEALLPVRILAELARLRQAEGDRSEAIFVILWPAMPDDHPIWAELRDPGTRFGHRPRRPEAELADLCIERALSAMTDPAIADHAVADRLEAGALDTIRGHGVVAAEEVPGHLQLDLAAFRLDAAGHVPRFVFASTTPVTVHPAVLALHDGLGGYDDPVGAVSWWLTPNPWLAAAPADLLGTWREHEIEFAAEQLANDSW